MKKIPDKFDDLDLQQKEFFAELGFKMYQLAQTEAKLRMSEAASELCLTMCQNQGVTTKEMQEIMCKANCILDNIKISVNQRRNYCGE